MMTIAAALYLFVPGFAANAMPVVIRRVPGLRAWNTPIAPRLLGANKTWRGVCFGMIAAAGMGCVQGSMGVVPLATEAVHATIPSAVGAALLLGAGALAADSFKSAFKRRCGIAPGRPLPIIDSIDYVVGGLLLLAVVYVPPLSHISILLVLGPLLSLAFNAVSYAIGWKEVWW